MGDVKLTWGRPNGKAMDVTMALTGQNPALPEDQRIEKTDWSKWIAFWDAVYAAQKKEEMNERHNHQG